MSDSLLPERARRDYASLRLLGTGAIGHVVLARERALGRQVAIKLLNPGRLSARKLARFEREAQAVAQLAHPNVAKIHHVELRGQEPFIVMEAIDGETLRDFARRASLDAFVEALAGVADGVAHAHGRGVLHRDLKPDNVLVERETQRALVTDFGLARLYEEDQAERLTATGELLGTPHYMSPEQALGAFPDGAPRASLEVGPPTDVYALGVMLFEKLAGRLPFANAENTFAVLAAVVDAPVPRPSQLADGVPASLEAICLRALERDPGDRYPSARAFAQDLRRYQRGERPLASLQRSEPRRAPAWAVAVSLTLLALGAAGGAALIAGSESPPPASPAPAEIPLLNRVDEALARADAAAAEALAEAALAARPGDPDPWLGRARVSIQRACEGANWGQPRAGTVFPAPQRAMLERAREAYAAARRVGWTQGDPTLPAWLDWAQGAEPGRSAPDGDSAAIPRPLRMLRALRVQDAQALDRLEEELAREIAEQPAPWWALFERAALRLGRGEPALEDLRRLTLEAKPGWAPALALRVEMLAQAGVPQLALADAEAALKAAPELWTARLLRALLHFDLGAKDRALAEVEALLADDDRLVGAWVLRAKLALGQRDAAGAQRAAQRAVELAPNDRQALEARAVSLSDDVEARRAALDALLRAAPDSFVGWYQRGVDRSAAGDWVGARGDLSQAIQLDPSHAGAYLARAKVALAVDDDPAAAGDLDQALLLDPSLASAYLLRAQLRERAMDLEGALGDQSRALAIGGVGRDGLVERLDQLERIIASSPDAAMPYVLRGLVHKALHADEAAFQDFTTALARDPQLAVAYAERGKLYGIKRRFDLALQDFDAAIGQEAHPETLEARAAARLQAGDPEGALSDLERRLALAAPTPNALYFRAIVLEDLGQEERAALDREESLRLAPQQHHAEESRARIQAVLGRESRY